MSEHTPTEKKIDELYELIGSMDIALLTTRRPDGQLVTRPMATQDHQKDADLWFVTNINTPKIDEIRHDPNVNIAFYNSNSKEWVSVSGRATITQDRAKIRELYEPDWKMWFEDEGGEKNGGPDDPRLALIYIDALTVHYMVSKFSTPRTLFELAQSYVTGSQPNVNREEQLSKQELN